MPGQLQQQALLRVDLRGLALAVAEGQGIEPVGAVEGCVSRHEIGVIDEAGGRPGLAERGGVEAANAVGARHQVGPEGLAIGRAGEAEGHSHNGDLARARACHETTVPTAL